MVVLNFVAWDLAARLIFEVSATLSVAYFIMSVCQVLHIWYNHFHPSHDWGKHIDVKVKKGSVWQQVRTSSLFKEIIINFVILILLILVFPILHI